MKREKARDATTHSLHKRQRVKGLVRYFGGSSRIENFCSNLPPRQLNSISKFNAGSLIGALLEMRNIGAYLNRSTPFCQIGNPKSLDAMMVIEQSEIDFLREGHHDAWRRRVHHLVVERYGTLDLERTCGGYLARRQFLRFRHHANHACH